MSIDEIQNSNDQYKQYPKFSNHYNSLKLCMEDEIAQVLADNIAVEAQKTWFP